MDFDVVGNMHSVLEVYSLKYNVINIIAMLGMI